MDELSEFEEDTQHHRGGAGNSQEGSEAELAHKYGLFDDDDGARGSSANENEGNVANAEGGEEEEASTDEDNDEDDDDDDGDGGGKSGNSEGEIEPAQDAEDDDSDMARGKFVDLVCVISPSVLVDIFQYVVDLLSAQPTDSEAAGNPSQETVGAPESSVTSQPHVVSRDNEGGGGSSSSGNDTLSHESGLFDTAFLENIDEDVVRSWFYGCCC